MKNLFNAAEQLAAHMITNDFSIEDFNHTTEQLDEGFRLLRPDQDIFNQICVKNQINPETTELVLICMKPEFAEGRTYSLPHMHENKTVTAVIPLSPGGTFLATVSQSNTLKLIEGKCIIQGSEPHAFGMKGNKPFIAALAVNKDMGNGKPIMNDDGTYDTTILEVISYQGTQMVVGKSTCDEDGEVVFGGWFDGNPS